MSAWTDRATLIISIVVEQARLEGLSYADLKARIDAAYPYALIPGERRNRAWRRIANWYLSVYARECVR